ncbi:MAG: cytochrome C oxidase subunit IV family protein [Flavobacteriaceae bacterium]|nr:cytochrome C oxidase subunit IV family protein [Flavobacteriaceae bacterium]
MAHDSAHTSNTKRIWVVFGILTVVTLVEVVLGIIRPRWTVETYFVGMKILNWIFIILTILKAYYIVYAFMHLEGETGALRWSILTPILILVPYLLFILLLEGDYIHDVFRYGIMKWDF